MTNGGSSDRITIDKHADSDSGQEWITVNGTPVPIDESTGDLQGEIGEKIAASSALTTSPSALSGPGANPGIPEMTARSIDRHFGGGGPSDHSAQYPGMTKAQYADRAASLARSPVGGDIDGYVATRGKFVGTVVRYDKNENDWVRAYAATGPATMFKPTVSAAYFEHIKKMET